MHGTAVEKARTDSHQVGSSGDPDLVPASLAGSNLRAVSMARPSANLRPGTGGGIGSANSATAASAAQLNFYEELCNRQLYRSSLHNLLTSCSGSPAGGVSTGLPSVETRCLTLGRNSMAHGPSAELQRRAASVAALATGRPETPACGLSAAAAIGSGSPPRWSHVPHSTARAGSAEVSHALAPPHSGLPVLEGTTSLPFGQLGLLLPPPPAAAVATAAAAGLQQRAALHRRARSMDESTSRQQKRTDAAGTSGAAAATAAAAAASATPAPAAQLPASSDRLHSSQATAAEQQQQAAMTVKPRPPAACGGAALKRSLPDLPVPVTIAAGAVSAPSSTPIVGVAAVGVQKVVLRKSLSSSSGDRVRALTCTPLDEKECCHPPHVPPPPPPAMAAGPAAVGCSSGGGFGEGTAGGSSAAGAKTQGAAAATLAAAHVHQTTAAARTSAAAACGARQRHAMHVDDSNYVVMSPIHVRSSSGVVEGCASRASASSSLSGDRRHSARSLEELSAGCSTQPLLPEPPHSGDRSTPLARGSASSGSRTFHPGCGPQPAPLLPCSASGDTADRRVGSASNAAVQAVGGACYADNNTYENVYRNGMPLCEPVVYANVSSIIRSRAVQTSAAKADLASAASESRCVLPPSLPPPPPPATETHLRCCTPPTGAVPSSAADGVPATQSTLAATGAHRSGSSTAACHGETVLSPTSSVASGSSVFSRMPSSCSVSNSSINSCVVAATEREALAYSSAGESHSPGAASSPTEDGERPGSRGAPLYVNVQECLLPSCVPPTGGCGSRSSPRPASPPPELNYAELMHTAPPAMVASSSGGGSTGSSSSSLARKRLSPCHPPTTLIRGVSSGSGTGAKVDSSSDGVLYAEINIAATEAAHKAQVHQTRYRQEQRNGLRADGSGSSAQPTTAGMADR